MEELIDIALKNPFLLILILGGLFSLFSGKSRDDQEEQEGGQDQGQRRHQEQTAPEQQKTAPAPSRRAPSRTYEKRDHKQVEDIQQQVIETLSIEEQRKEQMERLSAQYRTNEHSGLSEKAKAADKKREIEVQNVSSSYNKHFKRDFKKSLTQKGLINSIVMAEVLGRPRAQRPYESVLIKRKIK